METIDFSNELKMTELRLQIKEKVFEEIRNKKLFGAKCLWQTYMVRDFMNAYPIELRNQVNLVINELVNNHILELNKHGYKLTSSGEEIVYESDFYTIDEVINTILIYFREKNYYKNSRWPRLTALSFCEELIVYEQRLFKPAINKMLKEDLLVFDDSNNAYVITDKCQNKMFGLEWCK